MSESNKKRKNTKEDRAADKKRIRTAYEENVNNVQLKLAEKGPGLDCSLKRISFKNPETGEFEEVKGYLLCDHKCCSKKDMLFKRYFKFLQIRALVQRGGAGEAGKTELPL